MEMLVEVKPKKRRRRHRPRKRKGLQTIESINPGRAPLGFHQRSPHLFQQDNRSVATHASDGSEKASETIYLQSPSLPWAPAPYLPTSTPIPIPRKSNPLLLNFATEYPDTVESESFSLQDPPTVTQLSSSFPSTAHLHSVQKGKESSLQHCASPSSPKHRRCLSTMTGQRLPLTHYHRGVMEYEFPAIAIQPACIDSLDDLASSRPIPLSALSSRTSSRNKGIKAWKPLQLSDLELDDTSGHSSTRISEASQYNPRPRLTALHPFGSDDSIMIHRQGDPILSRNHQQEQRLADTREQEWMEGANASVHRNPLSYSSSYESPSRHSVPQLQGYEYEGPFQKDESCVYLEYPSLLTNVTPMLTGRPSLNGIQATYGQGFLSERSMLKPYYVHPRFTPYMSPQYEVLPHEGHESSQVFLSAPVRTREYSLQAPSHERYDYHRRMRSDGTHSNAHGQASSMLEDKESTDQATQMQVPNITVTRASITGRRSKAIEIKRPESTSRDVSKSSKKSTSDEQLRETLKRMVREKIEDEKKREAEKMKAQEVSLPDPFVDTESRTKNACLEQEQADNHRAPLEVIQAVTEERLNEPGMKSATTYKTSAASEKSSMRCVPSVFETFAEKAPKELEMKWATFRKSSAAREALRFLCDSSDPEPRELGDAKEKQEPIAWDETPPRHTFREDVSLAGRDANQAENDEAEHASRMDTILAEAENWFHTDNRNNKPLRLQIEHIAEEFAENQSKVADVERTKQTTELLGGIILNLHSYVSDGRKNQDAYFANFGTVPARCCEPSHGGRRSYFDRDPSDDHWITRRALPVAEQMPEKRLVLYGPSIWSMAMPDGWDGKRGF